MITKVYQKNLTKDQIYTRDGSTEFASFHLFLNVVCDSLAGYLPMMSFGKRNSYPHSYHSYFRLIYLQDYPANVRSKLNIVKSKSQRENLEQPCSTLQHCFSLRVIGILLLSRNSVWYVSSLFLCNSMEIFLIFLGNHCKNTIFLCKDSVYSRFLGR